LARSIATNTYGEIAIQGMVAGGNLSGMRTELVSIATDTVPLDGAFHWPEDRPARGGVLLFHGNTMNFYTGAPRWLRPCSRNWASRVSRSTGAATTS
jgi:hypothetical protein